MTSLLTTLGQITSAAFEKCGYDASLGVVNVSDRADLCQFQCNGAFAGAKLHRKAPIMIANDVAAVLRENEIFAKVDVAPPGFLNLTLTDDALVAAVRDIAEDPFLGVPQLGKDKTVVIDYGGPNVAKPLHIGHLRSAIIGQSIKNLARACGYNAIGDVHLGDWGLQMGLVIAELAVRNPEWRCFAEDFDPATESVPELKAEELNEIYPFASKKSKEDEEFLATARHATALLQGGHPGYTAVWKEILRASIADMKKSYGILGVDFEYWYGESDAEKYVAPMLAKLEERDLLRESDGALVVDVARDDDKAPMPPILVKKSDNSNLYATTDLATLYQREEDFRPDAVWYVVDTRQGLHFTQVFRCAALGGITRPETQLEFLGFGTMNGSDGKPFKTRAGGTMRLSDLLQQATDSALEKLQTSTYLAGVSEEEKIDIARKVGVAAVKFGDLINQRAKDYCFDIDKFLSFEGKTGPYILYTITRMFSILGRAGEEPALCPQKIYTDAERQLLLGIIHTGEAYARAMNEKAPNYLCENVYTLASVFSGFYRDCHILAETDAAKRADWLALLSLTKRVIEKQLDILGIDVVENM